MVNGIGGGYAYYGGRYNSPLYGPGALSMHRAAAIPAAQPEVPVEPVQPAAHVAPASSGALDRTDLLSRLENDPAAMAVRSRIQHGEEAAAEAQQMKPVGEELGASGVQKTLEEGECKTCQERTYQDGSNDPGVSFKTAAHIDPDQAASVVRGHEMEHVVREQAEARREGREVVNQSVTLHTSICPECGKSYVSGGVTRTVTRANEDTQAQQAAEAQQDQQGFFAVA